MVTIGSFLNELFNKPTAAFAQFVCSMRNMCHAKEKNIEFLNPFRNYWHETTLDIILVRPV